MTGLGLLLAALIALALAQGVWRLRRQGSGFLAGTAWGACQIVLWMHLIIVLLPMAWVFLTSMKSSREIFADPFALPKVLTNWDAAHWGIVVENFHRAWRLSRFKDYFLNSLKVTGFAVPAAVLLSAMAAYPLARFRFRGSRTLFVFFMAGMMIPAQLVIVPLFFQYARLSEVLTAAIAPVCATLGLGAWRVNLFNSHCGLVLIYLAGSLPFGIFLLANYMRTIPKELREAALIDGASEFQVFWRVMLPMARPGLATLAIFNFLAFWNEYLIALVFLSDDAKRTLPLGLANVSIQAQYTSDIGLMFSGMVITLVPVLVFYALLQKHLAKGLTLGALKG